MKKRHSLLLVALFLSSQFLLGQKVHVLPIAPVYNGGNYSMSQLRDFVLSNDPIVEDWISKFNQKASESLSKEDVFIENMSPKDKAIFIINNYSTIKIVNLSGFLNSGKVISQTGNFDKITYIFDRRKIDNVVVLSIYYRSIDDNIIKMNCFNLLGGPPSWDLIKKNKQEEVEPKEEEEQSHYSKGKYVDVTKTETQEVELGVLNPYAEKAKDDKQKTWVGKNLIWLIPAAATLVGGGLYLILNKKQVVVNQATMSGGRDYNETPSSTGTPSTGTGGGTGGREN